MTNLVLELSLIRKEFCLDLRLTLPGQGITVLFGPSGSGKTTLLRCAAGLEQAQGKVIVNDQTWQDSSLNIWIPTWARELGYVFQEASLFEHLDIKANLSFGLRRTKAAGAEAALQAVIALLGIGHLLDRTPQSLSGGERQRVAIARALATQPRLLLLDEPLASLDAARKREILPWIERLHTELKIPVLYVTHSLDELKLLADYVVLLSEGQALTHGPTEVIFENPIFKAFVAENTLSL